MLFQMNQRVLFNGVKARIVAVMVNAYTITTESGAEFTVWPSEIVADEEPECTAAALRR